MTIHDLFRMQRQAFWAHAPDSIEERVEMLERLQDAIQRREGQISQALESDLGKCAGETYMTETGMVLSEISLAISHLHYWARPRAVPAGPLRFFSRARILKEPLGVALIISPWNNPFHLALSPFVSALAAGNHCIIMPNGYAPATATLLSQLLSECFPAERAAVVLGGQDEYEALLREPFDVIFFCGGGAAASRVLEKAALHRTPVLFSAGGKSPVIVDESAALPLAARRIAFGKALSAGQSRIAPDYLLVQESVAGTLLPLIRDCFAQFFGDALSSPQWPRIISPGHYNRLMALIQGEHIFSGGRGDGQRIEPTILDHVSWDAPIMQEEVFGPVLPVIAFRQMDEILPHLISQAKPPALYLFTERKSVQEMILDRVSFGSGCVNDTAVQAGAGRLPLGGVGKSGMGAIHGKAGFDAFSHEKPVVITSTVLDLKTRYAPYSQQKLKRIKKRLK